jgi:hypothetical protein
MKNTCNFKKQLILAFTISLFLCANAAICKGLEVLNTKSISISSKVNPPSKKAGASNVSNTTKSTKYKKPNCMESNYFKNNKSSNKKSTKTQAPKLDEPITSAASYTFNYAELTLNFA